MIPLLTTLFYTLIEARSNKNHKFDAVAEENKGRERRIWDDDVGEKEGRNEEEKMIYSKYY